MTPTASGPVPSIWLVRSTVYVSSTVNVSNIRPLVPNAAHHAAAEARR